MTEFRKKPVTIEARQLTHHNAKLLAEWCGGSPMLDWDGSWCIFIPTLEGRIRASESSWIIRGVHGESYPCKPDIFEATYESPEEVNSDVQQIIEALDDNWADNSYFESFGDVEGMVKTVQALCRESARVRQVEVWAMKNEIAEPPLDWAGLGGILK